jgi:hypothetical protein
MLSSSKAWESLGLRYFFPSTAVHLWSRPVDDTESSKGFNTRWNRIVTVYDLTGCVTEAAEFFGLKLGRLYFLQKCPRSCQEANSSGFEEWRA